MIYEVFIPSTQKDAYDTTITVEAGNWMTALRSGLDRTGETETDIRGVMCDIKDDNTIHVTDAATRRVFVLKEINPEDDASMAPAPAQVAAAPIEVAAPAVAAPVVAAVVAPVVAAIDDIVTPTAPLLEPSIPSTFEPVDVFVPEAAQSSVGEETSFVNNDGSVRIGSSDYKALREKGPAETARVLDEKRTKSSEMPALNYARQETPSISENILEDIFLEIQDINSMTMEDAVNYIMDMAMGKIPSESGAILFAELDGQELYFATARGPKAKQVMTYRVPMGQGIVGFCAREGVSLAISDVSRDPRFHRSVSESLNYAVSSLVCVPIQDNGRLYGCIELLNRQQGSTYSTNEANALTYMGNQFGQYITRLIMDKEKL